MAQHDGLDRPAEVQGHRLRASTSIGIALYPEDGRDAQARGTGTKRSIEQAAAQSLLDRLEGLT